MDVREANVHVCGIAALATARTSWPPKLQWVWGRSRAVTERLSDLTEGQCQPKPRMPRSQQGRFPDLLIRACSVDSPQHGGLPGLRAPEWPLAVSPHARSTE